MAVTETITTISASTVGSNITGSRNEVGNSEQTFTTYFPANTTGNSAANTGGLGGWMAVNTNSIQAVYAYASTGATIYGNNTASPSWTIVLPPGVPYDWGASQGFYNCLVNANTTSIWVTCNAATLLTLRVLSK